jgi:hypothetical protein
MAATRVAPVREDQAFARRRRATPRRPRSARRDALVGLARPTPSWQPPLSFEEEEAPFFAVPLLSEPLLEPALPLLEPALPVSDAPPVGPGSTLGGVPGAPVPVCTPPVVPLPPVPVLYTPRPG